MSATAMYGKAVVLHAEDAPRPDTPDPGPHQRYRAPRLAVESRTLAPPAPGRLQVEMLYAGVCGTDLHLLQTDPLTGYVRTSAPATIPPQGRVIGHEGVGRVIAAGDGAGGLRAGSIVAFDSIIACLRCPVCRRGAPNQCPEALLLGMQADGLFATLVDVPASLAHDVTAYIDSDRDLRAAACLEPAGCALLACESARIAPASACWSSAAAPSACSPPCCAGACSGRRTSRWSSRSRAGARSPQTGATRFTTPGNSLARPSRRST
ncbi:MAG: alcohol dehydrogenase catalytic domain-containing protein [Gammaproteobacteria bacterium]|nr:alcohol dehydrogenase catalytic domain-containing protein [Gammaproteobacteria bacterium]